MKVLTDEASKVYQKIDTQRSKNMDKYALLKRFRHDRRLKVYMYAFKYVDSDTMPV